MCRCIHPLEKTGNSIPSKGILPLQVFYPRISVGLVKVFIVFPHIVCDASGPSTSPRLTTNSDVSPENRPSFLRSVGYLSLSIYIYSIHPPPKKKNGNIFWANSDEILFSLLSNLRLTSRLPSQCHSSPRNLLVIYFKGLLNRRKIT